MAQPKIFTRFEDIESELAAKAPPNVYKYRHWSDPFHRSLLTNLQVWFSHPFDLNDSEDIRPKMIFDKNEINEPKYFEKMVASAGMNTIRENIVRAENKLEEMKSDPKLLENNMESYYSARSNFNQIGIFSTAKGALNEHLWKEYSGDHSGFCVGFNTIELCRQMKSGYGFVEYCDEPIKYSFLNKHDEDADIFYYKKKKWILEDEFRFSALGIGIISVRNQSFKPETISEVILGYNIKPDHEKEIIKILNSRYLPTLPIFKTVRNSDHSLDKKRIR